MAGRLPMGLQLAATQARDDRLLSVAAWCEARLPFRALE
jgi:Asp-tRNA(Asn)/Glu-tRNA(Gln) amidotransferase A subunit family amidase